MKQNELYIQLKQNIKPYVKEGVCIAFSGGVDSSLLLKVACDVAKEVDTNVHAVLFDTFLQPQGNLTEAEQVAAECGALFSVLKIDELENPMLRYNPKDRCYHCKKFLYTRLIAFAKDKGCPHCMDGTNGDDRNVYRPGLQAVKELGIISPLAEMTKEQVRTLAEELGLSVAKKPSNSCLATRLEYGRELDRTLLAKIEAGEIFLSGLGFTKIRIRVHGAFLRIEIAPEEFPLLGEKIEEVRQYFKEFGWKHTTVDVFGFRSGTMDL